MSVFNKDGRLVVLISSLMIVVPMVVFPAKLGLDLTTGSFIYSIFEITYYGVILFILRQRTTFVRLLEGAGLTFLYRIVLGTIFGVLVSLIYSVDFRVALALGISRYLPAILLHIIAAPFVIKPFYLAMMGEETTQRRQSPRRSTLSTTSREPIVRPVTQRADSRTVTVGERSRAVESRSDSAIGHDLNGFERATRYLAEHHAVMIATVVDMEGLTVASFQRGSFDAEEWAPLTLLLLQSDEAILKRNKTSEAPDRLDLAFGSKKLIIMRVSNFNLLVLSNREEDDLLGIRITQAAEIIRKYASERYGAQTPSVTEEKYVSNT